VLPTLELNGKVEAGEVVDDCLVVVFDGTPVAISPCNGYCYRYYYYDYYDYYYFYYYYHYYSLIWQRAG
jgi:hypothetical protein